MKIKCINNETIESQLKVGQEYTCTAETETQYVIKLGNGVRGTYLKSRFERINK